VICVEIEIVIDKEKNVAVQSEANDRIALPGNPQLRLDEGYMWKLFRRIAYIRRLCVSHQDLVRLPFLLRQKGNRLGKDRGAPAGRNAEHQTCSRFSTFHQHIPWAYPAPQGGSLTGAAHGGTPGT
jgi:hypothetical protein